MPLRLDQPSFSGGEVSPAVAGRVDTDKVKTALRAARNVLIELEGGVSRRPGFEWVGEVYDSADLTKPFPFQFSATQSYVLEFGDLSMRVIFDGGYVLKPELEITGATATDPLVVTIPDSGYAVGDDVVFSGILGMTELNGLTLRVTAVAGDDVTFDVDASGWSPFTGSTGGVAGDSLGGEGGLAAPPAPDDPTPPFQEDEIEPPIHVPHGLMVEP